MYNCARLHTLFDSYERGVENGEAHGASAPKDGSAALPLSALLPGCRTSDNDCLSVGVYPEIPDGSQLDFSALKEEVPLGGCRRSSVLPGDETLL